MDIKHAPACYKSRADAREAGEWFKKVATGVFKYGGEGINTAGGFIVPEVIADAIVELRDKVGTFRQYTNVIKTNNDVLRVPKRSSGQTAYYVDENAAITESQTAWDNIQLAPRKIASIVRCSTELLDDSVMAAEWLTREFAYNLENAIEKAAWLGDGTSTYKGIMGFSTALLQGSLAGAVTAVTANADTWNEYLAIDWDTVASKLPARFHSNAKWFIHPRGWALSMKKIDFAAGTPTANLSFMGYPVVLTSALYASDSSPTDHTGLVVAGFGDPYYASMMGERREITVQRSDSRYLEYDQITFKVTSRFDLTWHGLGDTTDIIGVTQGGAMVGLVGG